ncbi:MAG TPA: DNA polymerase III subunit gamma/tau [Candidatus Gemmiger excrementavium]|uniref:DNA-directed DNA polymerase n=1 Tax=Candidatus Gemmiger excrementavium TaxID=2838608 RepID=A0A9D2F4G0_9FIRM|nr:DNA polymerase III subunit gamma/tau [Candidatus Gemmiger excrementavium]
MYRALYRKWRPQRFADVVGQQPIVTALQNQIAAGRIGHAYLFTGTRGTGKTTCAKIFAKAVNCLDTTSPDPCCACEICKGIDSGSIMDIIEMDAASNNGVDDIRDLRDEVAYLPSVCRYKVYIIDEVHMLSTQAFNALLKTMEEPPEHVIFILATTEVQKVPVTILSRCQRYDFARITAQDIAGRLLYVAGQEQIDLEENAAQLIGRLADGAMRDALSILDTCAGVDNHVDEALVRRMAGVTDRGYLFEISDAITARDSVAALGKIAELRQQSVDMRRLCMELAGHYRNLMLCALPGGTELLTGTSPEEEAAYAQRKDFPQAEAIRAINAFGQALEKMSRGTDQRIELELAVFSLTQPQAAVVQPAAPVQPVQPSPQPFAASAQGAFASVPPAQNAPPCTPPPVVQAKAPEPPEELPPPEDEPAFLQPELRPAVQPPAAPAPRQTPPKPAPRRQEPMPEAGPLEPFAQWALVLADLEESDGMLISFLRGTRAYYDGRRVLFECSDAFRDYIRNNREVSKKLKETIYKVTKIRCNIGPYEQPKAVESGTPQVNIEQTLQNMQALGVDVKVEDK